MTLDELVKLAQAQPDARAVTRVIVEALRDELRREWFLDDSGLESVERWMNEILASDGVEAEPTVGQRLIKAAKEAAAIAKGEVPAAAPDVCEWRIKEYCWETSCGRKPINTPPAGYLNCSCGLPISFKSEVAR